MVNVRRLCPPGDHYDPNQKKCVHDAPKCPAVQAVSGSSSNDCPICSQPAKRIASQCPIPAYKPGEHFDPIQNKCVPCPTGTELLDGKCQEMINITIVVHKVVNNSFITNNPTFLLLLDTAQLCQLAGDTQCVAKQNQFDTLNW
jgi:hypothetical protein